VRSRLLASCEMQPIIESDRYIGRPAP
jgi:hypothetical protein